jgi:hypothetical protein
MAQFRRRPERPVEMLYILKVFRAGLIDLVAALLGFQRQEELSIVELFHIWSS